MTSDFDYKKYSLEKLQEWVHDALSSGEASPHEIYSAIREAVREDYYYYKDHSSRASGLLELLSGHRPVKDSSESWEEHYYPEEYKGSTVSSSSNLQKEVEKIRQEGGYEWTPNSAVSRNDPERIDYKDGWIYESPDGGKTITKRKVGSDDKVVVKQDKVKKWVLPVEEIRDEDTGEDEYCISFPDDLLEAADLKEGDLVEWVDQGDGSYLLKKHTERFRF